MTQLANFHFIHSIEFSKLDSVTGVFKRTAKEQIMNSEFRAIDLKIIICKLIEAR